MNLKQQIILLQQWTQPHRVYHNLTNHLIPMLESINNDETIAPSMRDLLVQIAWWHDSVYEVGAKDNEEQSLFLMRQYESKINPFVEQAILGTINHLPTGNEIVDYFLRLDLATLNTSNIDVVARIETLIWKEYSNKTTPYDYCMGRLQFLNKMLTHPLITETAGIEWLINEINERLRKMVDSDIEARR